MTKNRARQPTQDHHWLLHKDALPKQRVNARAIVEQAHGLVHKAGASALSMRPLAAALGTSTSALYRHIPSRQWLLVAIVDLVLEEVTTSFGGARGQARRNLEDLSHSLRDVMVAHPHLHEILASHVASTPNTVRVAEAAFRNLRDFGIAEGELIDAYNAWCGYVIGFTTIEVKPRDLTPDATLQRAMRRQLEATNPNDFPIVTEHLEDAANHAFGLGWKQDRFGVSRSSFEWGLDALLRGFKAKTK